MSSDRPYPDLELEEDIRHHRTAWRVERAGWFVMATLAILALGGVFGEGPLSGASVTTPDARLTLHYERFTRYQSASEFEIEFDHARAEDDTVATVWFGREFLEGFRIESITPEPVETESDGERVMFSFARDETSARVSVVFTVMAEERGARGGVVGTGSGTGVRFRQIVYP